MMPGLNEYRAQIINDGSVQYNFPTVLNSVCRVTVTYFPFDTQSCRLKFGSWSHSQRDLDFYPVSPSGRNGVFTFALTYLSSFSYQTMVLGSDLSTRMVFEMVIDLKYFSFYGTLYIIILDKC